MTQLWFEFKFFTCYLFLTLRLFKISKLPQSDISITIRKILYIYMLFPVCCQWSYNTLLDKNWKALKVVTSSLEQKREIIAKTEQLHFGWRAVADAILAAWAKDAFGVYLEPNRYTITRILKSLPPLLRSTGHVRKLFQKRTGRHENLKVLLHQWICNRYNNQVNLSNGFNSQNRQTWMKTLRKKNDSIWPFATNRRGCWKPLEATYTSLTRWIWSR